MIAYYLSQPVPSSNLTPFYYRNSIIDSTLNNDVNGRVLDIILNSLNRNKLIYAIM